MARSSAKLTGAIQEGLLALLGYDVDGAKVVRALVTAKLFDPFFRDFAEEFENFHEKHRTPPGEHVLDIYEALAARRPDDAEMYERVYRSLVQTKERINRDYVLASTREFVRAQRIKAALTKAVPLAQRGDPESLNQVEALLLGLGKSVEDLSSPGLLLNDPVQALAFLDDDNQDDSLPLGVKALDRFNLGPVRKGLWLMIAPPNAGKTWCAVHLGCRAMLAGYRVLHVTLEMSERRIAQRYAQSLFSVGQREASATVRRFRSDELGRFVGMEESVIDRRPRVQDPKVYQFLRPRFERLRYRPHLIIKEFPTGMLTIGMLKVYLDQLEATQNFVPDELIVDYPDIMDVDPKKRREVLGKMYIDLRGIAVERNLAAVAFSQSNKLGMSARVIDMQHAAEDVSKNHTADIIFTFNQTKVEYELGLARMFNAKSRNEQKHTQALISQAYALGQFCVDSVLMSGKTYWSQLEGGSEEVDEDEEQEVEA